jgi:hypothetical protein
MSRLGKLRDDTDRIIMVFLVFGVAQLFGDKTVKFPHKIRLFCVALVRGEI